MSLDELRIALTEATAARSWDQARAISLEMRSHLTVVRGHNDEDTTA